MNLVWSLSAHVSSANQPSAAAIIDISMIALVLATIHPRHTLILPVTVSVQDPATHSTDEAFLFSS